MCWALAVAVTLGQIWPAAGWCGPALLGAISRILFHTSTIITCFFLQADRFCALRWLPASLQRGAGAADCTRPTADCGLECCADWWRLDRRLGMLVSTCQAIDLLK